MKPAISCRLLDTSILTWKTVTYAHTEVNENLTPQFTAPLQAFTDCSFISPSVLQAYFNPVDEVHLTDVLHRHRHRTSGNKALAHLHLSNEHALYQRKCNTTNKAEGFCGIFYLQIGKSKTSQERILYTLLVACYLWQINLEA